MTPDQFIPRPRAGKRTLRTDRIYLWVPRPLIVDIHYLAESFEGLLVSSTLDRRMGLVMITVAPQGREEAGEILAAILEEYPGIRPAGPGSLGPEPISLSTQKPK